MGDVINLRQARKTAKRAQSEREAHHNRLSHGRSKADKRIGEQARQQLDATVEGSRRDRPED